MKNTFKKDRGTENSVMDNIPGVSLKSDINTINAPIFALSKNIDTKQFIWTKGQDKLVVTPNKYGRATIWDKDIILYLVGQVAARINRGDIPCRIIRTTMHDMLRSSKRGVSVRSYQRLEQALRRLRNTSIETNINAGDYIEVREFSLIQEWRTVKNPTMKKSFCVEITLSEWLYNSIKTMDVLTYDESYFSITGGLERRLYEIFRKQLGTSTVWKIGEQKLFDRVGGRGTIRRFRYELKAFNGKIAGFEFIYCPVKKMIHVYRGSFK